MTTGTLLFYGGFALLALTIILAVIFAVRPPKYKPESAAVTAPGRLQTQPLRNGYPTVNPTGQQRGPTASMPSSAPTAPMPSSAPTAPMPSSAPTAPMHFSAPTAPMPSSAPTMPMHFSAPTAPMPSSAPTAPMPSSAPTAPMPSSAPSAPMPSSAPTAPMPSSAPSVPMPFSAPTAPMPTPSGPQTAFLDPGPSGGTALPGTRTQPLLQQAEHTGDTTEPLPKEE